MDVVCLIFPLFGLFFLSVGTFVFFFFSLLTFFICSKRIPRRISQECRLSLRRSFETRKERERERRQFFFSAPVRNKNRVGVRIAYLQIKEEDDLLLWPMQLFFFVFFHVPYFGLLFFFMCVCVTYCLAVFFFFSNLPL